MIEPPRTVSGENGANSSIRSATNARSASAREATGESGAHGSRDSMQAVASSRALLISPASPSPAGTTVTRCSNGAASPAASDAIAAGRPARSPGLRSEALSTV